MRKATQFRPESQGRPVTIRVRLQATTPAGARLVVADVLLQAGSTATGWVPNVTEMPWTTGVVGG